MNMARGQDPLAAEASFEAARTALAELVKQYPENPQFRRDLAANLRELGNVQLNAGKRQTARKNIQSSVDLLEKLVEAFPNERGFSDELKNSRQALNAAASNTDPPETF